MKRIPWSFILLGLLLVATASAAIAAAGYTLDWWTVDSGGELSQDAAEQYSLHGGIGQPDAAASKDAGGQYGLQGGFWSGGGLPEFVQYLPVILKH